MGHKGTDSKGRGLTRRDFLKTTAATVAASGVADFVFNADKALAYEGVAGFTVTTTTCPYCSASCGQRVVVEDATGDVVDIYGDFDSPFNGGGLCAKGAGSLQLVNNARRLGVGTGHASLTPPLSAAFDAAGGSYGYYRQEAPTGDGQWHRADLQTLMNESAVKLTAARGVLPVDNDSPNVAFFGSSHMNNEQNYVYRKLIANFGTTNTEHQARI